jgi:hypothetical protein
LAVCSENLALWAVQRQQVFGFESEHLVVIDESEQSPERSFA